MDALLRLYDWNLAYARALIADLSPAQATAGGGPGLENHPAWTLGQLAAWRRAKGLPSALASL